MIPFQYGGFTDPEAAGVDEHKGKPVLEIVDMLKNLGDLVPGEHSVEGNLLGDNTGSRKGIALFRTCE